MSLTVKNDTNDVPAILPVSPSRNMSASPSTSINSSVTIHSPQNAGGVQIENPFHEPPSARDRKSPCSVLDHDSISLIPTPSPTFHHPTLREEEDALPFSQHQQPRQASPPPPIAASSAPSGTRSPAKTVRWQYDVNENSDRPSKYKPERAISAVNKFASDENSHNMDRSQSSAADGLPPQSSSSSLNPPSTDELPTASPTRSARVKFQQQPDEPNELRRPDTVDACDVTPPRRAADFMRSMACYGEIITIALFKAAFLVGFPVTTILIAADNWDLCPCEEMLPKWLAIFGAIDLCINLLTWYTSRLATRRTLAPWCSNGGEPNLHPNASKRNTRNMPAGSVLERLASTTSNENEHRKLSVISLAAYTNERRGSTVSQTALTASSTTTAVKPALPTVVEIVRTDASGRRLSSTSLDNADNNSLHSSIDEEEAVVVPIMTPSVGATATAAADLPGNTLDSVGRSLDRKSAKMREHAERDVRWPEDWWTWSFVLVNILVSAAGISWLVYGCIIIHRTMNVIDLRRHSPPDQYCDPVLFYYTFCLIAFAICVGFMVFIFSVGRFVWVKFMTWRRRRREQDWDRRLAS